MPDIIGIQADPLIELNYSTDSTILLAKEFQNRGFGLFFYNPSSICVTDNAIEAYGDMIELYDNEEKFFSILAANIKLELNKCSILFIRQDPPFDENYLLNTYFLERLSCYIINCPKAIRNLPEKLSVLNFGQHIPPTLITSDLNRVKAFYHIHEAIVIKPIFAGGGTDVKYVSNQIEFDNNVTHMLNKYGICIFQKYLKSIVNKGDKRIFIIDGEIVGAIGRIPSKGSILANMAAGGKAIMTQLSNHEIELSNKVASYLKQSGIFMAGIDLIEDHLIEINITSPTGFKAFNKLYNANIEKNIVDTILLKI